MSTSLQNTTTNNNNNNNSNNFNATTNTFSQINNDQNDQQLHISPRDSMNNLQKNVRSKSIGQGGKKQKNKQNQYGNNKQSKKQIEQQLKRNAEESKANSYFSCDCQVCKTQVSKGHRFEIKRTMNLQVLQGKKIQFSKLIEYMLPPNEKVKGCQVLFPDTVFFGHGKPQFIAKCDREGCLMIIQQQSKLALQDIRQKFSTIVRERKKETQPIVFQSVNAMATAGTGSQNNQNNGSLTRQNETDGSGKHNNNNASTAGGAHHSSPKTKNSITQNPISEDEGQRQNNDEKSIFYKDTAVFRFIIDDNNTTSNSHANQQQLSSSLHFETNNIDNDQTAKSQANNNSYLSNKNIQQPFDNGASNQQIQIQDQQQHLHATSNHNNDIVQKGDEDDDFSMAAVKVVRDTEFINEFRRRANDEFWKTIDCIQTSVKAKTGIGHPVFVNFMAPINESEPHKDIDYSHFKVMQDDQELIRQEDDDLFCYKQCLKIAYYVSKVYNYEILQMKAEFLKDENNNIWFFYASNIQIRPTKNRNSPAYNLKASASQKANAQKEQLIAEIEQYEQDQNANQNKSIGRMLNIMDSYYSNMKSDMGIFEKQDFTEEDNKLDEVLRVLRPNTTANNFKEFLSRQDNITRTTHWKNIARKLDTHNTNHKNHETSDYNGGNQYNMIQQMQLSKQKQQYYMNKRTMSHDQRKTEQIQSILNAIDVSALGPKGKDIKTRDLMRVLNNLNKSTNFSDNISYHEQQQQQQHNTQKSVNLLGQTQRSLFQYSGPYGGGHDSSYIGSSHMSKRDQRSNFKAELVRNELLSRSDLMKLYQPPLKKSQLPTNNPFYTKTIVQLGQQLQPQLNLSQFRGNIISDNPYNSGNTGNNTNNNNNGNEMQDTMNLSQLHQSTQYHHQTYQQQQKQQQNLYNNNNSQYRQQRQEIKGNMDIQKQQSTIRTTINNNNNNNNQSRQGAGALDQTDQQSMLSYSINGSSNYNNNNNNTSNITNSKYTNNNRNANTNANNDIVVNWSTYQGTQKLAKQITKRMEYLKLTETFKHSET